MTSIAPDSTASTGSAPEPTLAEAFGELAAGIVDLEEGGSATTSRESSESTPAAPKQEKQDATDTTAAKPDRAAAETQQSATTPSAQANASPDATAQDAAETAELLAGSKPLSYNVDGETRQFEGVHEWEGGGAVITAEALPRIKDRLQQADRLVTQNRQLYEQSQAIERLGGARAIESLRAEKAVLDTAGALLLRALTDENTLIALATDPAARDALLRDVKLSAREAQLNAQQSFREESAKFSTERAAAGHTQTAIGNAVAQLAQGFPGLTSEDVQAVSAHARRVQSSIVRPANAEEARAAGVRVGDAIIDLPTLHAFLADRHALRTSAARAATTTANANSENTARLRQAAPLATGQRPLNAPRPGAGKKTAAPQKTLDQMTSAEITRAMKTGRIFDLVGADE